MGDDLIAALTDPAAHPHAPKRIDILHTHASILFFAGERVYKVKKAVNLGFLDFSTLAKRRHFCREELRLNRRLAPDIYRGIVPITRNRRGQLRIGGRGTAVEYAVEMVRLPAHRMLDHLIETGTATQRHVEAVVKVLVDFHSRAATGTGVDQHGTPQAVRRHLLGNLSQLRPFAGQLPDTPLPDAPVISRPIWQHLRSWLSETLSRHRPLLRRRVNQQRIRDGHGDLHSGNICMLSRGGRPRPVIYDCIEFDPALRCADVASDIAFLGMDLDLRERRDLSARLVGRYAALAGDPELAMLQPLYRCHFALVRAKVEAIRARDTGVPERQRASAWSAAARHANLAAGYTLPPVVLMMTGLPGSGKSWAAARLAASLGAVVLRADEIRKELAELRPGDRPAGRARDRLYGQQMTDRTYTALLDRARRGLAAGYPIVLDATYPTPSRRAAAADMAGQMGARWLVMHTEAPPDIVRVRMAARAGDVQEPSDADFAIYLKLRRNYQPPVEVARGHVMTVPTELAPEVMVGRAIERLIQG